MVVRGNRGHAQRWEHKIATGRAQRERFVKVHLGRDATVNIEISPSRMGKKKSGDLKARARHGKKTSMLWPKRSASKR